MEGRTWRPIKYFWLSHCVKGAVRWKKNIVVSYNFLGIFFDGSVGKKNFFQKKFYRKNQQKLTV